MFLLPQYKLETEPDLVTNLHVMISGDGNKLVRFGIDKAVCEKYNSHLIYNSILYLRIRSESKVTFEAKHNVYPSISVR
jgi:hypothetical protein